MDKIRLHSNIVSGSYAAKEIFMSFPAKGFKKIGWIIDGNLMTVPYIQEILKAAEAAGLQTLLTYSARADREPDYEYLDEVATQFRPLKIDAIIGIGGGTACDVAKAVGLLMKNEGKGIEYRGMDLVKNPGIPVILMPTTAGTGTEVTHTASFNDLKEKRKLGINGKNVSVELAVLDPILTVSCPRSVTLSSGLDAMVHAIEAVTAKSANEYTKMLGGMAFKILYDNFKKVIETPSDLNARMNMLIGSHFAGLAMANVGGGPASGISYPLGVWFKVPHGIAGGIFLGHVFEMNASKGYAGYAFVNDLIDPVNAGKSEAERAQRFVKNFWDLYTQIGGPKNLQNFNVQLSDMPQLVDLTMSQREANLLLNPVPCSKEDVQHLLEKVLA